MRAFSFIRPAPWYRAQAFHAGLRRAGFEVFEGKVERPNPGDVLLIWNRYAHTHDIATRFEREGGTVLVAENGYLGIGGTSPKFDVHPGGPKPEHFYALAVGGHNGQGRWPDGGPERWERLGIELRPWRASGDHVLVLPNRSFGIPGRSMPDRWAEKAAERLRKQTRRPVVIRAHPGNNAPPRPLEADLAGAWAAVVWSSNAGLHALVAGVPVFCEAPFWVGKAAAARGTVESPETPDRLPMFRRMAWAQWRVEEIETGEPFARLLAATGQAKVA